MVEGPDLSTYKQRVVGNIVFVLFLFFFFLPNPFHESFKKLFQRKIFLFYLLSSTYLIVFVNVYLKFFYHSFFFCN
jgi:hypothetical protein